MRIITLGIIVLLISLGTKREEAKALQEFDTIPCKEIVIKCAQSARGNFIIRNEREYKALLKIDSPHPDCASYELPTIDFDEYSLIGVKTSTAGCGHPDTEYYIIENKPTGEYKFVLRIKKRGMCKKLFTVIIWCLTKKINDSSKVEFDINETLKDN